jgi:hypothetical protein
MAQITRNKTRKEQNIWGDIITSTAMAQFALGRTPTTTKRFRRPRMNHFNPRQGKMSRRSEESVTVFRHAVLESDAMAAEEWLRILVQLPLPIVSITSSGGRSLHALLRLEAKSKAGWDQLVRGLLLPRLGPAWS